jgi:hypothetical protein
MTTPTPEVTTSKPAHRPVKLDRRGGRTIAYIGTFVGFGMSVAANIADVYVSHAVPGWGPIIAAGFWPLSLLLATEIMMRKQWPDGWVWIMARLVGLMPVIAAAAIISYQHLSSLMIFYHENWLAAHIAPIGIDGLMLMASTALLVPDKKPRVPRAASAPARKELENPTHNDLDDLILVSRAVLAEAAAGGRKPSKTALAEGLRKRGHRIGDKRVATLFESLAS